MPSQKAYAVVNFPGGPKVVASVSTTKSMIILSLGDGREEHYTYPADGKFHVTTEGGDSVRSFFATGPSFDDLSYYRFALVAVPTNPAELTRPYSGSAPAAMTIVPPETRDGMLEVGIVGQKASSEILDALTKDTSFVVLVDGPRSDTTVFFKYNP